MLDAINSSPIAIAAQSKHCTCSISAESPSSRPCKPDDAIQQLNFASDSSCCMGFVNLKPRKLSEHRRCAAIGDSDALRCSGDQNGDCDFDRREWGNVSTDEMRETIDSSSNAHEPDIIQDTVQLIIVCCMCGDAGVTDLLFLCSKCYRHQHIYCSASYPSTYKEISVCNWCLYEQDPIVSSHGLIKSSYNGGFTRTASTTRSHTPSNTVLHNGCHKSCTYNEMVPGEARAAMSQLQKTHGKAFEYLLLVVAQSFPRVDRWICRTGADIRQESQTTNSSNSNRGSLLRDIEIAQHSVTHAVHATNVAACDLAKPVDNALHSRAHHLQGILSPSNSNPVDKKSGIMNAGNHQDIRLHNQANMSIDHKKIHVGQLNSGNIPKRHRYKKGISASLKCRKKGLRLSPSKQSYRRYKLLADVVC